jgi:hypothetical protein
MLKHCGGLISKLFLEDLPVAAPYLNEAQTTRLLALWGLL